MRARLRLILKYERQRARLTSVPNTLGLNTTTEIAEQNDVAAQHPDIVQKIDGYLRTESAI